MAGIVGWGVCCGRPKVQKKVNNEKETMMMARREGVTNGMAAKGIQPPDLQLEVWLWIAQSMERDKVVDIKIIKSWWLQSPKSEMPL
jgi:hypothetical protein